MVQEIYIAEGCHITHLRDRECFEYEFKVGTYATKELAERAVKKQIDEMAKCMVNAKVTTTKVSDETDTYKYRISTITFES